MNVDHPEWLQLSDRYMWFLVAFPLPILTFARRLSLGIFQDRDT